MRRSRAAAASVLLCAFVVAGCHKRNAVRASQDEYVDDVVAFTHTTEQAVRDQMAKDSGPMRDEWLTWEKQGPMTPDRIKQFYKQTPNYIYELGHWHLWLASKRESDAALVAQMRELKPKNILDFGGESASTRFRSRRRAST